MLAATTISTPTTLRTRSLGHGTSWRRQWHDMLDHIPAMKYTFPEFMATFAVVQPWDYNNVNNAIRYGYQAYVAEVLRIRDELKETVFLGEFLDMLEVSVSPH